MPQAPKWLQDKFPGDDRQALDILAVNYTEKAGEFRRKDLNYIATAREEEALDYLWLEWDYGYDHHSVHTAEE